MRTAKYFLLAVLLVGGCSKKEDIVPISHNDLYRSAVRGDQEAQYLLGKDLCCHDADIDKAIKWLCNAARQDHVDAQFELGRIYAGDYTAPTNVPPNLAHALMWFELAEKNDYHDAHTLQNYRHAALGNMREEEIEYAYRLLDNWRNIPCGLHMPRYREEPN